MLKNRNREKFIQAILYFAHNTAALGKIKLFKLLYLLDFEHFRQTGRSVTGLEYRALKMGPVPSQLFQRWDVLDDDLAAAIRIAPEKVFDYQREMVLPLQPFNDEHFTRRELGLLEHLADKYRDTLSEKMIDVTHVENGAWAKVWAGGDGEYDLIPYELGISDDDPRREAVMEAAAEHKAITAAQGQ